MGVRILQLAAIGTAAGAFSALFGVGGGTVIVPLLVLWLGYGPRLATGTSLCAIVVIAAYGVVGHGLYGNVDPVKGLIVGVPAVAGVVAGIWVQQRIDERLVSLIFAGLLVLVAVRMAIG